MARDDQFSVVLMYEMFFPPSLLEKRLLRLLFRADEVLFGKRLRHRIDAIEERAFAETNDMHRTGFFTAEEDDFLLTWSLGSGFFWIVLFPPYLGQLDFYHVDRWSERKRRRLMTFYAECVRRQVALNGGRTHLSKNPPTFCGRVESLIETFPDAKFIVPMRNPYETIPSLLKMLQTTWQLQGRDERLILESIRILADQSFDSYCHPLDVLARHPEIRSCVVDYRDLVGEPAATMRRVYDELDLDLPSDVAAAISASRGQGHETTHRYSLEEFGLDPQAIHVRLAPPLFSTSSAGRTKDTKESTQVSTDHGAGELRAAWDDLTAALSRARDAVDSEELHAPPRPANAAWPRVTATSSDSPSPRSSGLSSKTPDSPIFFGAPSSRPTRPPSTTPTRCTCRRPSTAIRRTASVAGCSRRRRST